MNKDPFAIALDRKKNIMDLHPVRQILFSINTWGKGTTYFSITRNANSAAICRSVGPYMSPEAYEISERRISLDEFNTFADRLFLQYGFENWAEEYHKNRLDGTNWRMIVRFGKRQFLERKGFNAYPVCWEDVVKSFMDLFTGIA